MKVTITQEYIDSLKTPAGAWTARGFRLMGLPFSNPTGWKSRILGRTIDVSDAELATEHASNAAKREKLRASMATAKALFAPAQPDRPRADAVLHFDGSCWPNPGPNSQCGFKIHIGNRLIERTVFLGDGTNNTAEYHGLIHGLRTGLEAGATHVEVYGDSQLVIAGVSRMKLSPKGKPHLEALKKTAIDLAMQFAHVEFHWISREDNADADALSTASVTSAPSTDTARRSCPPE